MGQARVLGSDALAMRVASQLNLETKPGFRPSRGALDALGERLGWKALPSPSGRESLLLRIHKAVSIQPLPQARGIDIVCRTPDPQLSADVCNILVNEYSNSSLESRLRENQATARWLGTQLESLHTKLERSGNKLQRFASQTGIRFDAENKENLADEETKQLQAELSRAQADRMLRQAQFETSASGSAEALPQVLDSATLREYQANLTTLRRELAELSALYKPNHYKVVQVQAQIQEVEAEIQKLQENVLLRLRTEYVMASRRERMLVEAYANKTKSNVAQAEKVTAYNLLKREADTTQNLYDSISQRVNEATMMSALRATNVHVIDAAFPPSSPYSPNLSLNGAIGLFGGWVFGIGLTVLRAGSDQRLRVPGQVMTMFQVTELGVIPSANSRVIRRLQKKDAGSWIDKGKLEVSEAGAMRGAGNSISTLSEMQRVRTRVRMRGKNREHSLDLVTWHSARSVMADSFRGVQDRAMVFVLSSVNSGEGKTTIASNLAIALAEVGRRVLLVDGDLRKPRLHSIFGVSNHTGLCDTLNSTEAVTSAAASMHVAPTKVHGLWLLPSGPGNPTTSGILFSQRVTELFAAYRSQYDAVLVDSPPLALFADARVLGAASDGIVLVVRASQTTQEGLKSGLQRLAEDRIPVAGAILNDWRPQGSQGAYSSYAKYQ
jgi:capsular exopolysaccharide synthesis family protein